MKQSSPSEFSRNLNEMSFALSQTILLITSDSNLIDLFNGQFQYPYQVVLIEGNKRILDALENQHVDLIFMDYSDSQKDLDLVKELKQKKTDLAVPLILAIAQDDDHVFSQLSEIDDCIMKPISASRLVRRVTSHLKLVQLKREAELFAHNVFMQTPMPIVVLRGDDYKVVLANDFYLKVVEKGKELLDKPIFESLPELETQGMRQILDNVMKTGVPFFSNELEVHRIRNNKEEPGYFNFAYHPIQNQSGNIIGINVVATEVTELVIARRKMEGQQSMIQGLLMNAPGFVCTLVGKDHVYDLVNEKYQLIFGDRVLKGKAIMDALPELKGQGFDTILDNVYNTGETYLGFDVPIFVSRNSTSPREMCYFNFSYQPMYDEYNKIYSILVFGYEVTSQMVAKNKILSDEKANAKVLEDSVRLRTEELHQLNRELTQRNHELELTRERLLSEYSRSLIEATLDPLITIDVDGIITDVNEAMVKATDKIRKLIIGTAFFNYFIETEQVQDLFNEIFKTGYVLNYPLTIIDGVLTDVLVNGSVYKSKEGKVIGAVIVARDITALKKIEKELTEAKLFAELATIHAEVAKARAETAVHTAEDALKSKQQFLSNMSHEIRTPMNAIIGFTKVILKTELTSRQREYLMAIKLSGDALIVLINDILDLAKVDAGKMVFEAIPFKMSLSISAMLHLFEPKINEKNIKLLREYDSSIPEVLVGDPVRLHQIILNLVSNAVKFTNKGTITIRVKLIEEHADKVIIEFSVSDTGIGISENKIGKIFENFQQASSSTSRIYGGTGLGLAIVKQLVESQGGTIHVTSQINAGSSFSFRLSFLKTDEVAEWIDQELELDPEARNIKVLVVEDMALNQLLMKTLLDDFGFEREIVANGKIAIEKLEEKTFDIILMDLQMPEMNGFEATDYIRNVMNSKIPIIALTADVTTVDLDKCKAVGMNDYIAKPVDEKLLYSKIVSLVKKQDMKFNKSDVVLVNEKIKIINLSYLTQRTKSNPILILEMIKAYLDQTPTLVSSMKQSFQDKDWKLLNASVHKMIPSFSIMGMNADFEKSAKKIQEYAKTQEQSLEINELVLQLEDACLQACKELQVEFQLIKNTQDGK